MDGYLALKEKERLTTLQHGDLEDVKQGEVSRIQKEERESPVRTGLVMGCSFLYP